MKCPYYFSTKQVNTYSNTHNEDTTLKFQKHVMLDSKVMNECLLTECGAYQDGKCNY